MSLASLQAQNATPPANAAEEDEEVFTLSPFEVTAEANGYFQANAMSGTRLNSKIEDLAQSITVMTKDQMSDFAMLDINDVFDYMASTEGTNSYSDFVLDRTGAVTDNVAGDPNNANRVRGIGNANIAFNNIQTTGRVPVDPLWLDSVELSRGPNANIFGLGNSSGTVNQVPATANLNHGFSRVSLRGDSYGGWRTSIDHNQMVIDEKLAVRASWAEQHTAFIRKPSGENARRLSVQFKAKPWEGTTIAASWYGYRNAAVRPNFTTPRDFISGWFDAGQPSWNPVTRLITLNGVTYGQGMVAGSTTPITTMPSYFVNMDNRAVFRIGGEGEAPYWSTPTVTNTTVTAANPLGAAVGNNIRFVKTAPANSLFGATQPLFATYRPLDDKSIYDWEEINLMGNSKAWDNVNTYLAQVDQVILNTDRQFMAGQATFMREDVQRTEDLPMGPASVNSSIGEIYVDPNSHNLDGSVNPYFGRPYARTTEPFLREKPQLWDTTRSQVVYRLDFSHDDGWTKWLGTQQLLGYFEYKDQENRQYTWRNTAVGDAYAWQTIQYNDTPPRPLANRTTTGTQYGVSNNYMRLFEQYYLGDTVGGGIEYGPSYFPRDAMVPFVWGQAGNFRYDTVQVGWTASPDGAGGNASRQTLVKTKGAVLQSTFLGGKLVTTFGLRKDSVFDRNAPFATITPDFRSFDFELSNQWNDASTWRKAEGDTKTASIVARPFRDIEYFKDQTRNGTGASKFFAEALTSLSLTYNKSDNFIPQGPAIDLFLNPLPNQTGNSKDYGFWMSLMEGKLSLRYNHYKTDQVNFRNGDISTIAQRVLRADGMNANDAWNLYDRSEEWLRAENPSWTQAQIDTARSELMGLSIEHMDTLFAAIATGTLAATQDIVSEGDELEINYNPTQHWTVSASVTKTESINQNAGSTIEDWINLRMPYWTTIEDPRFTQESPGGANIPEGENGNLLWRYITGSAFTGGTYNYHASQSAASNFTTFVEGPLAVFRQLEGRPRPQMRKYSAKFNTRYNLSGVSENAFLKNTTVGGSVRWLDKAAIGFLGVESLPDTITRLDTNKPVFTPSETYVDLFLTYKRKLFDDIPATFQLNVKNVGEGGGDLLVTQVFPDGTPLAYRIIDPQQFIFTVSLDL